MLDGAVDRRMKTALCLLLPRFGNLLAESCETPLVFLKLPGEVLEKVLLALIGTALQRCDSGPDLGNCP